MPMTDDERRWLAAQGVDFAEHPDANGGQLLVFRSHPLPPGKFTIAAADILSRLPPNFPDSGPDMFWARPEIRLAPGGQLPYRADSYEAFLGAQWQRWSRHWQEAGWQSGIDGIDLVFRRIVRALEEAA